MERGRGEGWASRTGVGGSSGEENIIKFFSPLLQFSVWLYSSSERVQAEALRRGPHMRWWSTSDECSPPPTAEEKA